MKWRIGCSGFYYREWKEIFYPKGIPQKDWFKYYCQHFNTIEINSSFYKMPTAKAFEKWYDDSPNDFVFTIKAPRLVTHYKQLNDCSGLMTDFYETVGKALKEKLGCVLFQFPPKFSFSEERLEKIINLLDPTFTNVVEFRHESWWDERILAALRQNKIIFCGQSYPSTLPDQVMMNNPIVYYRFHGKPVLYKSEYPLATIEQFANSIPSEAEEIYVYFNNTWGTRALKNARQLQALSC